jgi:hypothetical protein
MADIDSGVLSQDTEDTSTDDQGGVLSQEDQAEEAKDENASDDSPDKGEEDKGEPKNDTKDEKDEKKPAGAPEKYEAFTVPDGFTIEDTAVNEFGALAKELNLTQEAAQKLVDYQVKFQQAQTAKLDEAVKKQAEDWAADTLKTYKKDELADARRGFKAAPKDVQQMLAAAGFDNHKSFVDFFMKVGRAIKEDKFETGKGKGGQAKSPANVIYPELN